MSDIPAWLPARTADRTRARHHRQIEVNGIGIDERMAPIMRDLWTAGAQTHQSCEGFAEDYDPARVFEVWTDSAWIGFDDLEVAYQFLRLLVEESGWTHPGSDGAIWLMPTGVPGRNVSAGIVSFPPRLLEAAGRAAHRLAS